MRRNIRQLFLIARSTAVEGLQQPACFLLALSAVVLTAVGPLVQLHHFGEAGRLARDGGLAFMLTLGLLVTGFSSGFTLSDELRRGTAATALAKPVGRLVFLSGKWLGVVGVLAVFCTTTTLATLLAERTAERFIETPSFLGAVIDRYSGIGSLASVAVALLVAGGLNFFRHMRFGLAAFLGLIAAQLTVLAACGWIDRTGRWLGAFDAQVNPHVIPAAFLIFLLLSLLAAAATALSTRLGTAPTLAAAAGLLLLGFLSDHLFGQHPGMPARLLYAVVPDVQHFWLADALASGGRIPGAYVARALGVALTYSAALLGLGYAGFQARDLP